MKHQDAKNRIDHLPWFKHWFDSVHYHKLYANRDENEAQQFMDALLSELQPARGASMIDVGCGAGRHCKYLASKGFDVTGIDTSFSSIRRATSLQGPTLRFFQHDMRIPFGNNRYDYVFNFFTSFGYFKSRQEHQQVIQNMCNGIKPGGKIIIDYLNVAYAEDRLIPAEEKEIDGFVYHITRWTDDCHFFKKIVINELQPGGQFEFVEQVAKFKLSDFTDMFRCFQLQVEAVHGDYQLNEYDSKKSPRLMMIFRKG